MLFFLPKKLKFIINIFLVIVSIFALSCTGSKKYFKAAERLEKQGLVNDAAEYYFESLQRKPTNVEARIKLKEVGQKYVSMLSSEFFRNYNTQQLEASMETYEKLKEFDSKTSALNVKLDYPKTYEEDYKKCVENYCSKNYNEALVLVNQKKYREAIPYLDKIKKYNPAYKNSQQLEIVAVCEPLYQSAINSLENKNYSSAHNLLVNIKSKTENYKDSRDLLEMTSAQQTKSFILFEPKPGRDASEQSIKEYLVNNFNQLAIQKMEAVKIINNTPFQNATARVDFNNNTNVDLIQAIRKATGADYFYVFDITNKNEFSSGLNKTPARGYQEVKTRKNDTLIITEYKPFDYNLVKAQRSFSYDFKYKIINAYTNQIVSSQTQSFKSWDAVEYQEFYKSFNGNMNTLYPYNPQQTAAANQFNPRAWRNLYSARNSLKSFDELKTDVLNQNLNLFINSAKIMK